MEHLTTKRLHLYILQIQMILSKLWLDFIHSKRKMKIFLKILLRKCIRCTDALYLNFSFTHMQSAEHTPICAEQYVEKAI